MRATIGLAAAALAAAVACSGAGAEVPRTVDCDYARAGYSVRDLPLRGGFFSPDSRQMAFPDAGKLALYDLAAAKVERRLAAPADGGPPVGQVLEWTSRGIFVTRGGATSSPSPDQDPNRVAYGQVWIVQPDGKGWHRVEVAEPPNTQVVEYGVPRVSPDGQRVAYSFLTDAANQATKPINGWRVAVADVVYGSGGSVRFTTPRFLTDDSYYNETKDWTGDSEQVVFASTRGTPGDQRSLNSDAYVIDARSGRIRRITYAPSWEEAHDLLRGDFGPGDADAFISDRDTPNPLTSPAYSISDQLPNSADSVLVATSIPALALWTSHELFVAGPDGDRGWTRRLTYDYKPGTDGWVARVPIWSPDGRYLRFDQWRTHGATAGGQRERLITFACGAAARTQARGCLNSRGGARGRRLGPAYLGRTRARQRRAFRGKRLKARGRIDRYCAAGGGHFRIGYIRGRAALILTSSRRFSVGGIRPGDQAGRLRLRRRIRVGRNLWFLARAGRVTRVYKVRGGRVREAGIADRRRAARRGFLRTWELR